MTVSTALKARIVDGKFQPDPRSTEYPFQRGWNAALEFVEQIIKEAEGANHDGSGPQQQRAAEVDHRADQ